MLRVTPPRVPVVAPADVPAASGPLAPDAPQTRATLDALVTVAGPTRGWNAVADILAKRLPASVAEALQRAELTSARYAPTLSKSDMTVQVPRSVEACALGFLAGVGAMFSGLGTDAFGLVCGSVIAAGTLGPERLSPFMQLLHHRLGAQFPKRRMVLFEYGGEVDPKTGAFSVSAPVFASAEHRAGVFVHESLHVLDFMCASVGSTCSMEPEFVAIADRMRAGEVGLAYPSRYARANDLELFAEAGSAYLDLPKRGCMSRAELRENNPPLYAYCERFFAERLPAALARGEFTRAEQWKAIRESDASDAGIRARADAYDAVRAAQRLVYEAAPDAAQAAATQRVEEAMTQVRATRIGVSALSFHGLAARFDALRLGFAHKQLAAAQHRKP